MSSPLAALPADKRRRLAATLGLFAALFAAIAAVSATGRSSAAAPVFCAVAGVVAILLALMAWGVWHSVRLDEGDAELDAAIESALAAHGVAGQLCGCGHQHDPDELHVVDAEPAATAGAGGPAATAAACSHDGGGAGCGHDCDTCVLAAMRPSPTATRADRLHS